MNNPINLSEIIIVNCTGIFCLLFLLYSKYADRTTKRVGEYLFNGMIILNIVTLAVETLSFLVDGVHGQGLHILQYLINGFLIFSATVMGYIWCLFVEFKVYHSLKRVHRISFFLIAPVVVTLIFWGLDCFGAGLLFSISEDNIYARGSLEWLSYLFIAFYYLYSIAVVYWAKHKGSQIHFFPVYTFVLPCILGTIVQGMKYGIAAGWFAVAIAILLVEMQLQKEESFVDELSGLYNRKYLEFFYKQLQLKNYTHVHGIMMDINRFKIINDTFGHTVGDDAIRTVSKLLSQWVETPDTVIRFAGDEFIVLCINKSDTEVVAVMDDIRTKLAEYNKLRKKTYELSFAMGYAEYADTKLDEFLRDMDQRMYEDKEIFRQKHR